MNEERVVSVAAFQMKMGTLFIQLLRGEIDGFRVNIERAFPTVFHLETWNRDSSANDNDAPG